MLTESRQPWNIIMWDVLSADFDIKITAEQCLENVLKHIGPGSIVVFHDSAKAWDRMSYALPRVLQYCKEKTGRSKRLTCPTLIIYPQVVSYPEYLLLITTKMFTDTHTHLYDDRLDAAAQDAMIQRAIDAGVTKLYIAQLRPAYN